MATPASGPMPPEGRVASPEMIAAANPPAGFVPIQSNSAFGWENGPVFHKTEGGVYLRGFRVAARHINAGGFCHGGMIMTFADILGASAVLTLIHPPMVTIRLTTDFIGPAFLGDWVEGTAEAHADGEGLFAVRGQMWVDNRQVATLAGLFKALGTVKAR